MASLETLREDGFDPGVEDEALGRDVIAEENVLNVLKDVEEPYRTAVVMRFIEGLEPREIAEALGESANVVSVRITRGLKKLSSLLPDGEET